MIRGAGRGSLGHLLFQLLCPPDPFGPGKHRHMRCMPRSESAAPQVIRGSENGAVRACVFCGSTSGKSTLEHAIPKWARRAFGIQGELTVEASKGPMSEREDVGRLKHLNIVLRNAICGPCNYGWLASVEKVAAPVLTPMAVTAQPAVLDAEAQAMLAFWAVKTVLLLQLAFRQMYGKRRELTGYDPTTQELAWLWAKREPPPRSLV